MRMRVMPVEFPSDIDAMVWTIGLVGEAIMYDDVRPFLIHINVIRKVEHIRGHAARRTHINFQRDKFTSGG